MTDKENKVPLAGKVSAGLWGAFLLIIYMKSGADSILWLFVLILLAIGALYFSVKYVGYLTGIDNPKNWW